VQVESLEKAIKTLPVPDSSLYNWKITRHKNNEYYSNVLTG
jgi:hypothetical protein